VIAIPSHRVHRFLDRLLLKKEYPQTHKFADAILGKGHRKVWGHSPFHTALLMYITKNINKEERVNMVLSHLLHVAADNLETQMKKKGVPLFDLLDLYLRAKNRNKKRYNR